MSQSQPDQDSPVNQAGLLSNLQPMEDQPQKADEPKHSASKYPHPKNQMSLESAPNRTLVLLSKAEPRLIIDRIILQNFKSYADRIEIGPFHINFTAVVGPNGSGKSNLIESMLFIFGYSASWMRFNKLSQLIHNSSSKGNIGKASVEVHFKKIQDQFDGSHYELPQSAFFIRREVDSDSKSKYFIDGDTSTQTAVKQKLKSEGIDLDNNRFLILQGEVEQISQMKQKSGDPDKPGLLEYLEDIIGSSKYITAIEEKVQDFNRSEEVRHEKGELMKLVENELKGISRAKQDAIKYVKMEKRLYQIQNVLFQVQAENAKHHLKNQYKKLEELKEKKERIRNEEREKMKKQAQRLKEIKDNRQNMELLQKDLEKENEQMNHLNTTDREITQEISFKSEDAVKYKRKIEQTRKELQTILSEGEQLRIKIPIRQEEFRKKEEDLQQMKQLLSKEDKPHLREKIRQFQSEIKKLDLDISTYSSKLQSTHKNLKTHTGTQQEHKNKITQYREKLSLDKEMYSRIEHAGKQAQKIWQKGKEKLATLQQQRQSLKNDIEKVDIQLKQSLNENKEVGMMNNLFNQIMKENIPGVIGRLGDLGQVPSGYDEIITTCCPRLDNIVVRNYEAATAVINYLKRMKLGRISCIILDKINDHRGYMKKNWHDKPKSVRLFDLVETKDEDVRVAFYFALNDTVYCEDSELGVQYAMGDDKNRRRVISRKRNGGGYIIYEPNGLMIGTQAKRGGFEPKAAKSKLKDRGGDDIRELENNRKNQLIKLEEITKQIIRDEKQQQIVQTDLEQMKREKTVLENSMRDSQEEVKDIEDMIKRRDHKGVSTESIEKEVQSLQAEINKLKSKKAECESKLKGVEDEQKRSETKEVVELRDRYKKFKAEFSKSEKELEKDQAILKTTKKRIEENQKSKEETQKRTRMLDKSILDLKQKQDNVESKAAEIFGKITAHQEKLKQAKEIDQKLRTVLEEDEKDVKESKRKIQQAKFEVEECEKQCKVRMQGIQVAQNQLHRIRDLYQKMSLAYEFMEELEDIQKMNLNPQSKNLTQDLNSSMLETSTILNQSMEGGSGHKVKMLPLDQLLKHSPFDNLSEDAIDPFLIFQDKLKGLITTQTTQLKKMQGKNLDVIIEFKNKYRTYRERLREFQQVKEKQAKLKIDIDKLKKQRWDKFIEGFGIINSKLREVYQLLTQGGDAYLQPMDPLDPFSDGVNFSVRPPKKSWKQINKLSGGEKTLSSLSLIFALHYYKPTPLYFMDEIDAALDFKNVSIVADYIKKRTKNAQFIIISLRNNMFDQANKLVGVYKTYDQTKIINLIIKIPPLPREKENRDQNRKTPMINA